MSHNEQRKNEWDVPQMKTIRSHGRDYPVNDGFLFVDPDGSADEGTWITDPTKSPDGQFEVDPEKFYGCDYLNWRDREENIRTTKQWTKTKIGNWYS